MPRLILGQDAGTGQGQSDNLYKGQNNLNFSWKYKSELHFNTYRIKAELILLQGSPDFFGRICTHNLNLVELVYKY